MLHTLFIKGNLEITLLGAQLAINPVVIPEARANIIDRGKGVDRSLDIHVERRKICFRCWPLPSPFRTKNEGRIHSVGKFAGTMIPC